METTLCIIKPDGVRRALVGEILSRFERVGLRISAGKFLTASPDQAGKHYTWEDIGVRHGEAVRNALITFLCSGPIFVFALEGDCAVENARRLTGATEPLKAAPGTIRGDYSHQSFTLAKQTGQSIRNLIHASANLEDAQRELAVWFGPGDFVHGLRNDHHEHMLGLELPVAP